MTEKRETTTKPRAPRTRRAPRATRTVIEQPVLPHLTPPPPRILLTGATGFVGRHILARLLGKGFQVVAVGRSPGNPVTAPGVIQVAADVAGDGWQRWCEGCSAAIHLIGIIREGPAAGVTFDRTHRLATERLVAACHDLGISRLVHMSALGARTSAPTLYHRSKAAGEDVVRNSGLAWTIFRPSVIFGPGDGFTTTLASSLRRLPVFPIFGDGSYRLQPISVADVADAFVAALQETRSVGRIVDLGGPEQLTYVEVLRRIAKAIGKQPLMPHIPLSLARLLVRIMERLPGSPITSDQLTMLLEGSTCDTAESSDLFRVPVARFQPPF